LNSMIKRIDDLKGLRVIVMGLGLNGGGLASARFLSEHGALVTVTDMKSEADLAESIASLDGLQIRYVLGKHEIDDFINADLVIKNPAVHPDSPFLKACAFVETDISLFLRFTQAPIIAITGSKGKSSVSTAIHHILSSSGQDSFLGGNITVSPLSFFGDCRNNTPVVLELSSWQLADMRGLGVLKPLIAVITSIMPDHMNRYTSMDEYVADKRLIYSNQDSSCYTICNMDDDWGHSFAAETMGRVLWYSSRPILDSRGAWLDIELENQGYCNIDDSIDTPEIIVPASLIVPGDHQRKNMLSAALACRAFGIPAGNIASALTTFVGVEHRLERFLVKDGISWYNDSAATIPQAVAAAISSFSSPVILITGGTDKNLDFEPFIHSYSMAKELILLSGTGTDKLISLLDAYNIPYSGPYDNLNSAISHAAMRSNSGDNIVLSPGCASFGMFVNEFDRGHKYKKSVIDLFL
jgi:UDP-N-acetylmuramoylalanine--D-glutamate ligase